MESVTAVRCVKSAIWREGLGARIDGRSGRRKAAFAACSYLNKFNIIIHLQMRNNLSTCSVIPE